MAKLARIGAVDWTVLAAALSLMMVACEPAPIPPVTSQTGGASASGGASSSATGGAPTANGGTSTGTNSSGGASTSNGGTTSSSSGGVSTSYGGATSSSGGATTSKGGATSSGGASTSNGGATSSGGASTSNGGATSSGGASTSSGGASSSGGAVTSKGGTGGVGNSIGGSSKGGATSTSSGGASTSVGGATGVAGGGNPTGGYNPDFKEFYGDDCTVGDPKDANASTLPDLFATADGSRLAKKSDWRCQRAYLKKVVEKYIHGAKPGKPDTVTGSVTASSIKVHVAHGGKSIDFSVSISMPTGVSGAVPAIIGLGGGSLDASIVKGEGVAIITYDMSAIADEKSRSGLFTNIYGSTGASAQVGWAWGVSRIIDVLVTERDAGRNNIIDPTAIGVTGCSRLGKGAFTIGAFDERIALGIPQESGTGGVSAFRVVNTSPSGPNGKPAQSLDSAWTEAQGWFGTTFGTYKGKVNTIPGDTHSLVAMYAPRGLLVLDNSRIGELCASCQHAASAAGAVVYKALGVEKNIEYNGGNPSDPHNHCSFYAATQGEPLKRAIRTFLTKKAAADGRIAPQTAGTADLAKWITWTAPALAD